MSIKSFFATAGIGAAMGAATVLLMPKNSKFYKKADSAAQMIKMEAGRVAESISGK